jgi:excisionase family DNA binding protein
MALVKQMVENKTSNYNHAAQYTENKTYSHKEAAEYLCVAVQTLYNWRHERRGPSYVKMGRKIVYRQNDLDRYMESNTIDLEA